MGASVIFSNLYFLSFPVVLSVEALHNKQRRRIVPNLSLSGNPRYQPKDLQDVFGYDNLYRCIAEVEIATLRTLADIGVMPESDIQHLTPEVEAALLAITTSEVVIVERNETKHDIRAWVKIAQSKLHPSLRRWVHVPLTSYDVIDSARALQFSRAHKVVSSLVQELIAEFAEQVKRYKRVPQIGRTHGQHALPITVGLWFATVLQRLVDNAKAADRAAGFLVGKIAGPVGAYNAQVGLGITKLCGDKNFEERVLNRLGLKAAPVSTQIVPPEYLADLLWSYMKLSATFGQLGRDARHLMRTEIGELSEPFEVGQVGSSTMAHKRNPINFENLEGTWQKNQAEFFKVLCTMVSEHQRDLTGSCISRDFPTIVVNLVSQLNTLLSKNGKGLSFISRLRVDEERVKSNLAMQGDDILAEPIYIALQMAGFEGDAHHLVNHVALPEKQKHGGTLFDAVFNVALLEHFDGDSEAAQLIYDSLPDGFAAMCETPGAYFGLAREKAEQVVESAELYLSRT